MLAGAAMVVFRTLPYAWWGTLAFDSDQAVVGLMAKHIAEFRALPVYQYAVSYVLILSAYVVAPFMWLLGPTLLALKLPLVLMNTAVGVGLIVVITRTGVRPAHGGAPGTAGADDVRRHQRRADGRTRHDRGASPVRDRAVVVAADAAGLRHRGGSRVPRAGVRRLRGGGHRVSRRLQRRVRIAGRLARLVDERPCRRGDERAHRRSGAVRVGPRPRHVGRNFGRQPRHAGWCVLLRAGAGGPQRDGTRRVVPRPVVGSDTGPARRRSGTNARGTGPRRRLASARRDTAPRCPATRLALACGVDAPAGVVGAAGRLSRAGGRTVGGGVCNEPLWSYRGADSPLCPARDVPAHRPGAADLVGRAPRRHPAADWRELRRARGPQRLATCAVVARTTDTAID